MVVAPRCRRPRRRRRRCCRVHSREKGAFWAIKYSLYLRLRTRESCFHILAEGRGSCVLPETFIFFRDEGEESAGHRRFKSGG